MSSVLQALSARILTIKVGSTLLVRQDGRIRREWLGSLAADIRELRHRGSAVVVVTSGAVALGRRILNLPQRELRLDEKQAAAAAGQISLAGAWRDAVSDVGIEAAQLLVTLEDTENRRRYLNARSTLTTLLTLGAVPVVNENDTVATAEIRFGDNDRLSARVAIMAGAESLILLSDVDGLYSADPKCDPGAEHISEVTKIDGMIEAMAGGSNSNMGTGGMVSKISAAQMATQGGTAVVLAQGSANNPIKRIESGNRCTLFHPRGTPRSARKQWIAAGLEVLGRLIVDDGAATALGKGASLLSAGVTSVDGSFEKGEAVHICRHNGHVLAKGLCAYGANDARKISGRHSHEIVAILGWRGPDEIVHRDDMVLFSH